MCIVMRVYLFNFPNRLNSFILQSFLRLLLLLFLVLLLMLVLLLPLLLLLLLLLVLAVVVHAHTPHIKYLKTKISI